MGASGNLQFRDIALSPDLATVPTGRGLGDVPRIVGERLLAALIRKTRVSIGVTESPAVRSGAGASVMVRHPVVPCGVRRRWPCGVGGRAVSAGG